MFRGLHLPSIVTMEPKKDDMMVTEKIDEDEAQPWQAQRAAT